MSQAAPERLVANRYALEASIPRQGRAGVVWRAADLVAGGAVAVEEIEPRVESEAECNARWSRIVRGARAAASLDHPGVVRLYDVLLDAGRYFVVTELADALPLDELIDRHGRLPPRRVARIGLEVLDVLDAAHRAGLAHLDLQPAHVLVTPDGAVRLAGLGLAEVRQPAPLPACRPAGRGDRGPARQGARAAPAGPGDPAAPVRDRRRRRPAGGRPRSGAGQHLDLDPAADRCGPRSRRGRHRRARPGAGHHGPGRRGGRPGGTGRGGRGSGRARPGPGPARVAGLA